MIYSRRLCVWVGIAWSTAAQLATAQPVPVPITLAPDAPIERRVGDDRIHRYQISLAPGEAAHITLDQHGVDAQIDVLADTAPQPDAPVARFQEQVGYQGQEQIDLVAERAVTYTLLVRMTPGLVSDPAPTYTIRLSNLRSAEIADRAMWDARTLEATGNRLNSKKRFAESQPIFEKAARIVEQARGPETAYAGALWFQAAMSAYRLHDSGAADTLIKRSLAILDKAYGPQDPFPAWVRTRLAQFRQVDGQYREAELVLQPVIGIIEKALGPEHMWYLRSLSVFGMLRIEMRDLESAEEAFRRILAGLEKTQQTENDLYAATLNNLGEVGRMRENYDEAESLYSRSLALAEKLEGQGSPGSAVALQNLSIIADLQKKFDAAIDYSTRALAIKERVLGPEHLEVAQVLNNLGRVYYRMGDDGKALQNYRRALNICEKIAVPYHRCTLIAVANMQRVYAADDDLPKAIAYEQRVNAIIEQQLDVHLSIGSERQKLVFASGMKERTDRSLSLSLVQAPDNPDASALGALVVLQRKGRVLDSMTDAYGAAHQRIVDTGDRTLLDKIDQLRAATAELASAVLSPPPADDDAAREHELQVATLRKEVEKLEADLNLHSGDQSPQPPDVSIEAVQAAIPENAALVEFVVYHPIDPKLERLGEACTTLHYAAYVLRRNGPPHGIDLGVAQHIDDTLAAWRETLRDPTRRDQAAQARKLDEMVMRPLRAAIGNATHLLVSPDGDLNLASFDAMVDERGKYLIEHYAISYLTSGRDLLRMQGNRTSRSGPVILADPLFGEPIAVGTEAANRAKVPAAARGRRSVTSAEDLSTMYFAPLMASAGEAKAIKALFPESTLLLGRRATKEALQHVDAPRVLHIASHGFFLQEPAASRVENPLLRSGVALAGANLSRDARDDGILTALEASNLNLWGTKLVTLSACDTGVGQVRNGEGVYGLRRAFALAGAETLVMSLWPVSDTIARETMTAYYTGLHAGLGRGEALRQAKLAMLKRNERRHPFYWASFIQSGEWGNLDGRR
jgi:CHAT domain-containing protein/Tfp pilus assembly protein PilF